MWVDFLMWAGGIIFTCAAGITSWVIAMVRAEIKDLRSNHDVLETRFDAHRLYAAETFTTKADVKDMTDRVLAKLDKIDDKLDKKADKPV